MGAGRKKFVCPVIIHQIRGRMARGKSTLRNMHFPVCVSVASAERNLQGAPFTAVQNMKHRSGIGRNAANKGKHNCPNSKSMRESILENAFLEAYKLLAGSFDDVIDSVIDTIEGISTNNEDIDRLKKE